MVLISELKKSYTVVIVTHNMQQAARIADKVGFFMLVFNQCAKRYFYKVYGFLI